MDYNYQSNYYKMPPRNPGQTMAVVSMILGVVSIFTLFTVYIPIICGSIAIVLAILSKGSFKKMLVAAKVGIGTAVGAITLLFVMIASLSAMLLSTSGDALIKFGQQIDQQFKEQTGQEILQYIVEAMPWVVVGYNNDLNKMFSGDYQNFLQLRYNQVPRDPYAGFSAGESVE